MKLPRLGFGVSGPHGTPLVPEALTAKLIHQALEGGANLFDTAPFYGDAEARLGRALKGVSRDRFLISTKLGKVRRGGDLAADFSPGFLRSQLEASLKTLGVESIDILFLHGPPEKLSDEARAAFLAFKAEGKARALGICGRGPEIAANAEGMDAIMAPAFSRWAPFAQERGLAFLGIEAMTGARRSGPPTLGDVWRFARSLRRGATRPAYRTPEQALAAALAAPGMTSVLVTTTSPAHLAACLAVTGLDGGARRA
ncbi:MAG TPA: aldo/keto reductase [Caulobacterales bacterium]|nr:aldo/keto reductase [Caulobacterales bacterium]